MEKVVVRMGTHSKTLENVKTYADVVRALGKDPKKYYYVLSDGEFEDLPSPLTKETFELQLMDENAPLKNKTLWHTSAHILAYAVKMIYPEAKEAIGPVIDRGFFEDIDFGNKVLHPDDLPKIIKKMKEIIKKNYPIVKRELSREEAKEFFKDNGYKIANIEKIPLGEKITTYRMGDYEDLCMGPHLFSTGQIDDVLLTNISSAYFQGDSEGPSLQRITGISFANENEKKKYELFMEEAHRRDHRKIGKELELFSFFPEGPGFPFWFPKGTALLSALEGYLRKQNRVRGYVEIHTPQVLNDELWKQSGHYAHFKENMYFTQIDERHFALKPMNCPGGCLVYGSKLHSYRELPIKQAEFGLVHRHELSGALHGLFRVRSFTQDDAHIFCIPSQIQEQIKETTQYIMEVYKDCGFSDVRIFLSTRPDDSMGSDEDWEIATKSLSDALDSLNLPYGIKDKEGAFYGPKLEFHITDVLERSWQCGTVQVDFSMPARFGLFYEDADGTSKNPIMIHRAIVGSLERFVGILLEHYAGKLPLWLSPVQVHLINVASDHEEYVKNLVKELEKHGVRTSTDMRNETLGYKIRHAKTLKTPFIGVIGDKERETQTLSIRDREDKTKAYSINDFCEFIKQSVDSFQ